MVRMALRTHARGNRCFAVMTLERGIAVYGNEGLCGELRRSFIRVSWNTLALYSWGPGIREQGSTSTLSTMESCRMQTRWAEHIIMIWFPSEI
jgi:hypothetical protein